MSERNVRIITKKTSTPGKIPTGTTGNELNLIREGELAANLADRKLFSYDGSSIFEFGSNSFLYLTGGTISGSLSVGSFSASSIYSGSTNLYDIFALVGSVGGQSTYVQPGINTYTGGTSQFPTINVSAATLTYLSATTISGGTIYSGSTNLYDIFALVGTVGGSGATTYVQPGSNIQTGGTASSPIISLAASPSIFNLSFSGTALGGAISATTVSGGTIYSGSTNLYDIFALAGTVGQSNYVQPGLNTYTGGTSQFPTVNVSAATLNSLSVSGSTSLGTASATTIYSGSTNLSDIFHQKAGYLLQKAGMVSGSTFAGNPKKAIVVFSEYFPDNNYSVTVTGTANRTWTIESKTLSGFTINANAKPAFSSSEVYWDATEDGEGFV